MMTIKMTPVATSEDAELVNASVHAFKFDLVWLAMI